MAVSFTTDDAPSHRKLAMWQDIVCDVFVELDCRSETGDFRGAINRAMLGPIACSEVDSGAQRVTRTASRIARSSQDFILVALGGRGHGGIRQDDREIDLRAGELAFYDTTRPYELSFDGAFTQTIYQIPRASLVSRIAGSDALTATVFDRQRPLARLAVDFLGALATAVDRVDADTADRLADQALDLLAMALGERLARTPAPSTHRAALLYRIKAHMKSHLADPELSLGATAAALGISPRYINRLLAEEQTSFQRLLLELRLARCARELGAPAHAHRQIGEIAFAWGFSDLSHFGRAFRARYGLSPRDWRHQQRAGGRT